MYFLWKSLKKENKLFNKKLYIFYYTKNNKMNFISKKWAKQVEKYNIKEIYNKAISGNSKVEKKFQQK